MDADLTFIVHHRQSKAQCSESTSGGYILESLQRF